MDPSRTLKRLKPPSPSSKSNLNPPNISQSPSSKQKATLQKKQYIEEDSNQDESGSSDEEIFLSDLGGEFPQIIKDKDSSLDADEEKDNENPLHSNLLDDLEDLLPQIPSKKTKISKRKANSDDSDPENHNIEEEHLDFGPYNGEIEKSLSGEDLDFD